MGLTIDDIPEEGREFFEEWKAARYREMAPKGVDCSAAGQREECPHDELDHGYCLDCGKDCLDMLIDRADMLGDD